MADAEFHFDASEVIERMATETEAAFGQLMAQFDGVPGATAVFRLEPSEFAGWDHPSPDERQAHRTAHGQLAIAELKLGKVLKAAVVNPWDSLLAVYLVVDEQVAFTHIDGFRPRMETGLPDPGQPPQVEAVPYSRVTEGSSGAYVLHPDGTVTVLDPMPAMPRGEDWEMFDVDDNAGMAFRKTDQGEVNVPAMELYRNSEVAAGLASYEPTEYPQTIRGDVIVFEIVLDEHGYII